MRIETKLIKRILKVKFPNAEFKVYTQRPSQYYTNSDKIIVEVMYKAGSTYEEIIKILREYVLNIDVQRKGAVLSVWGQIDPFITDIVTGNLIEVDAEFIEVR